MKRARHDKPYSYKKKGNEEQATFNARVDEAFVEAESTFAGAGAGTSTALEHAQQSLQLLTARLKLIHIADRSELGWRVVTEYTADELANDSDDEKRLEKAKKAAERKAGKRKKKQTEPPFPKRANRFGMALPASAPVGPSGTQVGYHLARRPPTAPPPAQLSPRVLEPCFAFGEMRHILNHCPKTAYAPENRKWYSCPNSVGVTKAMGQAVLLMMGWIVWGLWLGRVKCLVGMLKMGWMAVIGRGLLNDDSQIEPGNVVCPWEVEDQNPVTQVKGRVKGRLSYWRDKLKAPQYFLNILEHGYVLPLKSEPSPFVRKKTGIC